jgi:hypothetical protein
MLNPILELNSADVKAMLRKLKDIEPNGVKEFRQEINRIAKPVADQIKLNIPNQPPLSGMGFVISRTSKLTRVQSYVINEGRLNWQGTGKQGLSLKGKGTGPKSLTISSAIKASGRSLTTPIAKVIINSPAVSMADMAGRKSNGNMGTRSREYVYRKRNGEIVKRRHRVNGQGRAMIQELTSRYGKASRFGWPALEKQIDDVAREIDKVLQKYFNKAFGDN